MSIIRFVAAVVGVAFIGLVAVYLLGQFASSMTGYVGVMLILGTLAAVATFRRWNRRDRFSRELTDTWGRTRQTKEPGREEEELTK